jgi:TetR/AcrR family transcriptional regulator
VQPSPTPERSPVRSGEGCSRLSQCARANRVIEAAVRLFAQKGFQGAKTKEIAEAAGINEALIFRDFHTKEKLYCAILDYASNRIRTEQWIEELSAHAAGRNDYLLFSELAARFLDTFAREPVLFRVMLYSALEQHELAKKFRDRQIEPLEKFIANYVQTRQREGGFGPGDPRSLAHCFLSMCHNRVLRRILFGPDVDSMTDREAANVFTRVFLTGVVSR